MEGPGMSLFQGAGSIHINNSAQDRLEEQEELEDQKRRDEELKHKLVNAFDDLLDDDEASSVNSSANFTMEPHTNGGLRVEGMQQRPGLPTYVESLNHLKDQQGDSPKLYNEMPKNHLPQHVIQDDPVKLNYSPFGAGDGQNHYYQQGQLNGVNNYEARQEYMNHEQLKLMYEMRVKEFQLLAGQLEELRSQSDAETESLHARLAAAAADRDKAELSLQQAHHALASSKHQIHELEQRLAGSADKLCESERDKEQLRMELRAASVGLQEAQQRLHSVKVAHTHDTDTLFREQQDRHRDELERLHHDLQKYKTRLEEKESEVKILEKRCQERDREKEEIIIEKGATINRLVSELEQAQSRLVSGESARLKERVSQLTSEKNTAREQVKELGAKLELTAHDLVLCRSKLVASQKEFEGWRSSLHQILLDSLPENTYLGEPPSPGKLSTLKEVLSRYKQQIHKLSTLQEEVVRRDNKLEHNRKQEAELRSKLEAQKGIEMQLTSRVAVLQNKLELLGTNTDSELLESYKQQNENLHRELEDCRAECKSLDLKYTELEMENEKLMSEKGGRATLVQEANADLLKELDRYSSQLKDTLRENGELKTLYLQACSTRDAVSREMKDVQSRIQKEKELYKSQEQEYVSRLEKEREQIEKLTFDLTSNKEELERANKRISELQKEFNDKQKEFSTKLNQYLEDEKSSMRKEMESCSQCDKHLKAVRNLEEQLNKCNIKLASQESNEELMKELKSKAEFFQGYIVERFQKLQEQRNVGTNTEVKDAGGGRKPGDTVAREGGNSDDDLTTKTNLMLKEKEIREQIAQKFTLEIKTVEMNCTKRLKEMENEHINAFSKIKKLLENKAQEVDMLKEFILAERAKVTEILTAKEDEISDLIKEHNSLQSEYQQLKDKAGLLKDRYQDKLKALEEKYKNEKETCRRSIDGWEKEKQNLNSKLSQLDSEYQVLKSKYKNAKKMAFVYKDYIEKKDAHVTNELGRIQHEYKDMFLQLEGRIKFLVSCRIQQTWEQDPAQEQQQNPDFSEMMSRLQNDISALAQSKFEGTPALR